MRRIWTGLTLLVLAGVWLAFPSPTFGAKEVAEKKVALQSISIDLDRDKKPEKVTLYKVLQPGSKPYYPVELFKARGLRLEITSQTIHWKSDLLPTIRWKGGVAGLGWGDEDKVKELSARDVTQDKAEELILHLELAAGAGSSALYVFRWDGRRITTIFSSAWSTVDLDDPRDFQIDGGQIIEKQYHYVETESPKGTAEDYTILTTLQYQWSSKAGKFVLLKKKTKKLSAEEERQLMEQQESQRAL
jgi:hypothetical protein